MPMQEYVVEEPDEEDRESTYIPHGEGPSRPPRRSHSHSYRTGDASGYCSGKTSGTFHTKIPMDYQPEKKWASTMLNLNCVTNRKELIEAWDNQMHLIIMTDNELRDDLDLIETLVKEKTIGVARAMVTQVDWTPMKMNPVTKQHVTGEEFLRHITNYLYSVFTGYDCFLQGPIEQARKVEKARQRLERLQICDLCLLPQFYCDYEENLMVLPMSEWEKYIEAFLRKVP